MGQVFEKKSSKTSESEPASSCDQSVKEVDTSSKVKKQQYDDNYLTFGFVFTVEPSCPLPLCLLCGMTFSNHAMGAQQVEKTSDNKSPTTCQPK